jgi:lambda family phage tail tape measure protein
MNILARLGVALGLNTAEFTAGIEKSERELKRFERNAQQSLKRAERASQELTATMGKLSLAVGVASIGIGKILQKSDEIADMASAFDASIGSIVGMGKALELSGGKAEDTSKLLSKLTQSAQGAKEGSDKLRIAFREIGVSAQEVENLNPDELFNRVAEQLAKISDPVERNAKAFELLGKSAKGIDWRKYTAEYKEVADPDLVQAIQTSAEAWDNIQKAVGSMFYFVVKLIQPLSALVNQFLTLADRYQEFKQEGGTINFDPNNPMGEGIEFKGTGKTSTKPEAPKRDVSGKGGYKESSAEDKRVQSAREALKIASDRNALEIKRIELESQRVFMNEYDYKRQLEAFELEKVSLDLKTKINDLEKQKNKENAESTKIAIQGLQKQIEFEKEKSEAKIRNINLEQKNSQSWAYGWEQAFKKFGEDAQNYAKVGGDMFNSIVGNMNKALDNFVQNGKFSFKDFTRSVIQDLIAIQLKAQAMKMFSGMGGIFGNIGTAMQFGTNVGSQQTGMLQAQMAGFADGGSPPVGVPSIVGERGAELFIPKQAGTIVPNNQLSSLLGTGTTINYNAPVVEHLSAIDTQSGMQFLMKNKESIWSANQSASRGLPASR